MHVKDQVNISVYARDAGLHAALSAGLAHWAKDVCVNLELRDWDGVLRQDDEAEENVLLLDVESLGEQWLERLRAVPAHSALILVTDDPVMAIQSYCCHPTGLLQRRCAYPALKAAMNQCFSAWRQGLQWLDLPAQRERIHLPVSQVWYAEAEGRNSILSGPWGSMRASIALGKLEEVLPSPPFVRCQKGFLIHLGAVEKLVGGELIMSGDRRAVAVGRQQMGKVRRLLKQWRDEEEPME